MDKAIAAETNGFAGQVCIDRNRCAISALLDSDYDEGDWDLHQAAIFSALVGFTITVPATVTVLQGTSQATFTINSSLVTLATTGTITATWLGATAHSSLTLYPTLSSLRVSPSSVPGGAANATLVMWQGANAPAGGAGRSTFPAATWQWLVYLLP